MGSTNDRKLEHIQIINEDPGIDRDKFYFDQVRLTHRALPELRLNEVDPQTVFMGKTLSFPFLISSMTGGEHDLVRTINHNLARAAEQTGVAMGVGSQRVMFIRPEAKKSFELRSVAPSALLFANLGAVQLNYGFTEQHAREAVETAEADALYFHLNPLQEAVQPEGNTDFSELADKLGRVAETLDVPLVLKEVGAGISQEDVRLILDKNIRYIDVAGAGGTSWSRIEHHRREAGDPNDLGLRFQDWGIPTPLALQRLAPYRDRLTLIASGGIRSGIDMVKAIILGASLCGLASPFLKPAMRSADDVIEVIERLKREFVTAMFLLGIKRVDRLQGNASLIL